MSWITLDEAKATADMPSDVALSLANWIGVYPEKAGRLGELTAAVVSEFRTAIASVTGNYLDPVTDKIPDSCLRSAEAILYGTLQMEMGSTISTAANQALTRAEIFLRQISYGNMRFTSEGSSGGASVGTPSYTPGVDITRPERALPGGGEDQGSTNVMRGPSTVPYPSARKLQRLLDQISIAAGKKLVIGDDGTQGVADE